jgi:hypothetical protein
LGAQNNNNNKLNLKIIIIKEKTTTFYTFKTLVIFQVFLLSYTFNNVAKISHPKTITPKWIRISGMKSPSICRFYMYLTRRRIWIYLPHPFGL